MNGQIETFTVEYISDIKTIFFKKGERYEAFLPLDEQSGKVLGVIDRDGEIHGLPGGRFRRINPQVEVFAGEDA